MTLERLIWTPQGFIGATDKRRVSPVPVSEIHVTEYSESLDYVEDVDKFVSERAEVLARRLIIPANAYQMKVHAGMAGEDLLILQLYLI